MAKKSWWERLKREPKFLNRHHNRCCLCGRSRSYYRKFRLCRICLRNLAHRGEIPGLQKASW
jgi:small subunit ribosomal protein S14